MTGTALLVASLVALIVGLLGFGLGWMLRGDELTESPRRRQINALTRVYGERW